MGGTTLKTVAEAAGVSVSTVSNAYNKPDQLSAEVRERVIPAVRAAGSVKSYEPLDYKAPAPVEDVPAAEVEVAKPEESQNAAAASTAAAASAAPAAAASALHQKESLISVHQSKLDELSALVGEIVITEAMVTGSPDLKGLRLDNFTKSARR